MCLNKGLLVIRGVEKSHVIEELACALIIRDTGEHQASAGSGC